MTTIKELDDRIKEKENEIKCLRNPDEEGLTELGRTTLILHKLGLEKGIKLLKEWRQDLIEKKRLVYDILERFEILECKCPACMKDKEDIKLLFGEGVQDK